MSSSWAYPSPCLSSTSLLSLSKILHLINTIWLTPWSKVLLENLTCPQLVLKTLAFYGTQRFITAFTRACHLLLSWARSIQSMPHHHNSWRSFLILSSRLCLGLPGGLFPSDLPTKTLNASLLSPISVTCPICHIFLDLITQTIWGDEYRSLSSSLCNFPQYTVTSSLLGPNILLNTLFSNTLSLCSSLTVRHPAYPHLFP